MYVPNLTFEIIFHFYFKCIHESLFVICIDKIINIKSNNENIITKTLDILRWALSGFFGIDVETFSKIHITSHFQTLKLI